jgi:Uma2 family endonuclease
MKVVMLEVPEGLLEERRRKGLDHRDEVWEGVLHMVPQPSEWHQGFGGELFLALAPVVKAKGLVARYEISVHRPGAVDRDYRTPDLLVCRPSQLTKRGVIGRCEVVIEILSPGDETYDKIPFYAAVGVRELLVFDPDARTVELYVRVRGGLKRQRSASGGLVRSRVLGVGFKKVRGPRLRVFLPSGEAEI